MTDVRIQDLHPALRELVQQATWGEDLFETVRLQKLMIDRILDASLCGTVTLRVANEICQGILSEDLVRLEALLGGGP